MTRIAIKRQIFVPPEYTPSERIKIPKVICGLAAGSLVGAGIRILLGIPGVGWQYSGCSR